jgi:hypothetical protein
MSQKELKIDGVCHLFEHFWISFETKLTGSVIGNGKCLRLAVILEGQVCTLYNDQLSSVRLDQYHVRVKSSR